MEESKLLVLLSKIHQKTNNTEEYSKVLMNARDVQIRYKLVYIIVFLNVFVLCVSYNVNMHAKNFDGRVFSHLNLERHTLKSHCL